MRSISIGLALLMALTEAALPFSLQKHALEDKTSWDLFQRRQGLKPESTGIDASLHRQLKKKHNDTAPANNELGQTESNTGTPYTIQHKKPKRHIPYAGGDTTHGMMIDAGSQGTRLHIYEWEKRFLLDQEDLLQVARGMKLSIPTSDSRWTDKYTPGLDVFAFHHRDKKRQKEALQKYLGALIDFAKEVLKDKEEFWSTYPIFLKATGGMRTLPLKEREQVIDMVRELLNDHEHFNPFAFEDEQARVISGEEEAIYGWVGVNFAKGTLIENSAGTGVGKNPKLTYGMLEMGGASTQIAFFENKGDLLANLFKLQLGGARHWNVYTHSYLYFGINGAWTRLNSFLHGSGNNVNPCLPVGSEIEFASWVTLNENGKYLPRSNPRSVAYNVTMVNNQTNFFDFGACSDLSYALLREKTNEDWCDFEMDGSCAIAGIYQPPLPKLNSAIDEFIATSNFVDAFNFLQLGSRAPVSRINEVAKDVCSLSWEKLKQYNADLDSPIPDDDVLAQMCFRSLFIYHLLRNGWGFGDDFVLEAADIINGQKMGWALGCMLYEINTLPWEFHPELLYRGRTWWQITIYVILGMLCGSAVGFVVAMRFSKKFNRAVRNTASFRKSVFARNPMIRKSLAIPLESVDEFQELNGPDQSITKYT